MAVLISLLAFIIFVKIICIIQDYQFYHRKYPIPESITLTMDGREAGNWPIEPINCPSTHGGAGYISCSYHKFDEGVIVCGACGTRIKDPRIGTTRDILK
jgi:hypothetical protein